MSIELIIGAGFIALLISIYIKHREKPVDMNHKAPNVHNVVSKTPNGPAKVEAKAPAKKAATPKKKVAKKTTKKTTKKTSKKK